MIRELGPKGNELNWKLRALNPEKLSKIALEEEILRQSKIEKIDDVISFDISGDEGLA